jgi:hypothetical protein
MQQAERQTSSYPIAAFAPPRLVVTSVPSSTPAPTLGTAQPYATLFVSLNNVVLSLALPVRAQFVWRSKEQPTAPHYLATAGSHVLRCFPYRFANTLLVLMMFDFQGSNLPVVLGKCVGRCSIVEARTPLHRVREDESRTFPKLS